MLNSGTKGLPASSGICQVEDETTATSVSNLRRLPFPVHGEGNVYFPLYYV